EAANKSIAKLMSDAQSFQKLLEKTMNDIDAFHRVTVGTTPRSIVAHFHRAHKDFDTVRDAIRHMKSHWEAALKRQANSQVREN
ncbi:hypothetical protein, partial [Schlesneria sp.]|uniref:hypothetical protein n=1 Tax=Schlesneria sp. TaxID=2762018 RepID=UPI002F18AD30